MPASWEIKQNQKVLIGILHVEIVSMAWALGYDKLIKPGPVLPVTGSPFDHSRNTICAAALHAGLEYVFMLDSDVIPPPDAILRLLNHRQPIISGTYHRRSPPHGLPVMQNEHGWMNVPPNSGIVEAHLVGAGCLLIHRSVLEKLPPLDARRGKRWFDWRGDMAAFGEPRIPPTEGLSEDFSFCRHARQHGYRVLVDTGVQCRHAGLSEATYNNLQPLNHVA